MVARKPSRSSEKGSFPGQGGGRLARGRHKVGSEALQGWGAIEWPTRGGAGAGGSSSLLAKEAGRLARDLGACPQPGLLLFLLGISLSQQTSPDRG